MHEQQMRDRSTQAKTHTAYSQCVMMLNLKHLNSPTSSHSSQLVPERRDRGEQREQASHHHSQLAASL